MKVPVASLAFLLWFYFRSSTVLLSCLNWAPTAGSTALFTCTGIPTLSLIYPRRGFTTSSATFFLSYPRCVYVAYSAVYLLSHYRRVSIAGSTIWILTLLLSCFWTPTLPSSCSILALLLDHVLSTLLIYLISSALKTFKLLLSNEFLHQNSTSPVKLSCLFLTLGSLPEKTNASGFFIQLI